METSFDGSASGLSATNVQSAIDEVVSAQGAASGSGAPTHTPSSNQPQTYVNTTNGDLYAYNVTTGA